MLPDPRAVAIVAVMERMGLRCVEVARLEVADWDRAERLIYVWGKGGRRRTVPVPDDVAAALAPHVRDRDRGPIFGIGAARLSQLVSQWMRQAGLKSEARDGKSAHALRHRAATEAYRRTKDLQAVQQLLGHKNVATTDRYLARADLDRVRAALGVQAAG